MASTTREDQLGHGWTGGHRPHALVRLRPPRRRSGQLREARLLGFWLVNGPRTEDAKMGRPAGPRQAAGQEEAWALYYSASSVSLFRLRVGYPI